MSEPTQQHPHWAKLAKPDSDSFFLFFFLPYRILRTTRFASLNAQTLKVVRWRCAMRIFQACGLMVSRTALPAFRWPVERKSIPSSSCNQLRPIKSVGEREEKKEKKKQLPYDFLFSVSAGWATSTLATVVTNMSLKWGHTSTGTTGEPTSPRSSPSVGWETCRRTAGAALRWAPRASRRRAHWQGSGLHCC